MRTARRSLSVLTVTLAVAGLMQVAQAQVAQAGAPKPAAAKPVAAKPAAAKSIAAQRVPTFAVAAKAIVCTATVALGTTSSCDLPAAGGTARYRFHVPSADTVRFRAAVETSYPARTLTLSTHDGTQICTKSGYGQFDCAVPAAGNYRLDVSIAEQVTVLTTIDSVRRAACGPGPDLSVGNTGTTVDISAPGASWCVSPLDATAGDVLEMVLDVNTDAGLLIQIYSGIGALQCSGLVSAYVRVPCTLSSGSGFRLFASSYDDTAPPAVLVVARLSHPSGCGATHAPDAFGAPASRHGSIAARQQRCYRFVAHDGEHIGVHLFGVTGPSTSLKWFVRTDAGISVCNGETADLTRPLVPCTLGAAGTYTLFVSPLTSATVSFLVSLTDLSSDDGCAGLSSTAWNATPDLGSLAGAGQVDCHTFTAGAGDRVRPAVFGTPNRADGLLVSSDGAMVCAFYYRTECTLPSAGTYRALVSTYVRTAQDYRLWVIDTASTAGCSPTTLDDFGVVPHRPAHLTSDRRAVCWTFTGEANAAYFATANTRTGTVRADPEIRSLSGAVDCVGVGSCRLPSAGTYLFIATRAFASDDPSLVGRVSTGLWRLDQPTTCPTVHTNFTAPAVHGNIDGAAEVDCNSFGAAPGDRVHVRSTPSDYSVVQRIYDASGEEVCFASNNTCTLTGPAPYRVVTYPFSATTGSYEFRVVSLTHPAGCQNMLATPFGQAPTRSFEITDIADVRCFKVQRPSAVGLIGLRLVNVHQIGDFGPKVTVYDPELTPICSTFDEFRSCPADGSGQYLLIVESDDPADGTLGFYDLASSAGCRAGPSLAFGEPATAGQVSRRGTVSCLTLPYVARDKARLVFGRSADTQFNAWLVSDTGSTFCNPGGLTNCVVPRSVTAPVRVLVWVPEYAPLHTGMYHLHAWRLNDPTGCVDIGSLRDGFGPLVGTLRDGNDEACYAGRARNGDLTITASNDDDPTAVPYVHILNENGGVACVPIVAGGCVLFGGDVSILVIGPGGRDFPGHYRVIGDCTSETCGP